MAKEKHALAIKSNIGDNIINTSENLKDDYSSFINKDSQLDQDKLKDYTFKDIKRGTSQTHVTNTLERKKKRVKEQGSKEKGQSINNHR